jgi:hypothetical protein
MITGMAIGVAVIAGGYFLLHYLNDVISELFFDGRTVFRESTIQVLAIFLNVFPFRYLMMKTPYEYTGRGILLVTFIVGISYFFYYLQWK